jgi:hypothetical protein
LTIKKKVMDKILLVLGLSPEVKEELAALAQDVVETDDWSLFMGPMSVFHEGARFDTKSLSDEEYVEMWEFLGNPIIDSDGYIQNMEYLPGNAAYRLVKKYGILSLVARVLEAKECAFDRLWELAKKHPDASFEKQEAIVLRGIRAINTLDVSTLWATPLTWTLEGQEGITCEISDKAVKDLFDDWGVTALVKELIGD